MHGSEDLNRGPIRSILGYLRQKNSLFHRLSRQGQQTRFRKKKPREDVFNFSRKKIWMKKIKISKFKVGLNKNLDIRNFQKKSQNLKISLCNPYEKHYFLS